jgi:glycerate kinase
VPLSDGGDGFGAVMGCLLNARPRRVGALDAAHRPCRVRWWWDPATGTAVIESAEVIGLAKLPLGEFHPFGLDTFGLGALLRTAAQAGARRCLVGVGGSATNDGGFGLARGLGWRFLDRSGRAIEQWTHLERLARLEPPARARWFEKLSVAVDVRNPLLGPRGATRVYGPQKGLRPGDFALAEQCLRRLARVVKEQLGRDVAQAPGAGAAGGLGFGLQAFAGAHLEPGFDLFARHAGLPRRLRDTDLVLTGEGAVDTSTFMGKGVGRLGRLCQELGIPCLALAGTVSTGAARRGVFSRIAALTELTSAQEARARPGFWLQRLAEQMARSLPPEQAART